MHLQDLTRPDLIFADVPGTDQPTVLRALADRMVDRAELRADAAELYAKLWEREELGSTGIGSGVAIPHCKLAGTSRVVLAVGVSREPVEFEALDQQPVRLFFVLVSPEGAATDHLKALASISRWVKQEVHVRSLLEADSPQSMYELLAADGTGG